MLSSHISHSGAPAISDHTDKTSHHPASGLGTSISAVTNSVASLTSTLSALPSNLENRANYDVQSDELESEDDCCSDAGSDSVESTPQEDLDAANAGIRAQWVLEHGDTPPVSRSFSQFGEKVFPHYGTLVKQGVNANAIRSAYNENGQHSPIQRADDEAAPENYIDVLVCRHLALAYLDAVHPRDFIDNVVNADQIVQHFAKGEGLKHYITMQDVISKQAENTKQQVTNHAFGEYLTDTILLMRKNNQTEEKIYINTESEINHAVGLRIRLKNEPAGESATLYAYDPNLTGNHLKMKSFENEVAQNWKSVTLTDVFPTLAAFASSNGELKSMSVIVTSMSGLALDLAACRKYFSAQDVQTVESCSRQLALAMRYGLNSVLTEMTQHPSYAGLITRVGI
ncbi:MAG: ShET2/EspL2 family type III secretion system effector toxin [Ottowia sp.]|nr:ShET2/EspL2 family type III secretion system effector toxin [Ottowia sp.]